MARHAAERTVPEADEERAARQRERLRYAHECELIAQEREASGMRGSASRWRVRAQEARAWAARLGGSE